MSVVSYWIHAAAAKHPDRVAIEERDRSLTYADLRDAAVAARSALGGAKRVAIALPPGADFMIAVHACLLVGAAAVPIDLRLSAAERAQRLAGAELVISEPLGVPSRPPGKATGIMPTAFGGDPPVAVMHTSGTTAAPKPVVLSHSNFMASAQGSAIALGLDPAERWLCPMPLTHVGGLSIPIRSAIYATTAVLHGRFDTEAVLNRADGSGTANHDRLAGPDDAGATARRRLGAAADAPLGAARRRSDRTGTAGTGARPQACPWRRRTG